MCCWLFYSLVVRPLRNVVAPVRCIFIYIWLLNLFSLDEFTIGVWKDVSHIQDPSLVSLASSRPRVVLNAKARNTTKIDFAVRLKLVLFTFLLSLCLLHYMCDTY